VGGWLTRFVKETAQPIRAGGIEGSLFLFVHPTINEWPAFVVVDGVTVQVPPQRTVRNRRFRELEQLSPVGSHEESTV
jgi:hypothetical protein